MRPTQEQINALAKKSKTSQFPNGGWQYPFDFGGGIIAPTFTKAQTEIHPFRKDILIKYIMGQYGKEISKISVLDLGAGEGALALALWQVGVKDITCVEARSSNIEKGQFVKKTFNADYNFIHDEAESFLKKNNRKFDIVIVSQLLWIVSNPIMLIKLTAKSTNKEMIIETVLAQTKNIEITNNKSYAPTEAAFFIREVKNKIDTGSLDGIELWPNKQAFQKLLDLGGFSQFKEFDFGRNYPARYKTGEWIFGSAKIE